MRDTNINVLLDDLSQMYRVISQEKNIELKVNKYFLDYSFEIVTDEVKLRQVLINLISNAFKFTKGGYIEVGYKVDDMLNFYVRDTGIGMKKENLDIIFERFSQIENEFSFHNSGSGLGLAISKAYVEMLGGKISVESEVNVGTTFSFTIPVVKPEKESPVNEVEDDKVIVNTKGIYILIAEDNDDNYLYLSQILASENYTILRAYNGKEVLEILESNKKIKFVLMDIKMPVMNGYEALPLIKSKYPTLPVYAQTAYALEDDRERIMKAGFNGYIAKPFNKSLILKTISLELHG